MKTTSFEFNGAGFLLFFFALAVFLLGGWALNILALLDAPTLVAWGGIELLRALGVFLVPLGAVMGWFV